MILKSTAKRRRRKSEIEDEERKELEEEKVMKEFEEQKAILASKNLKPSDVGQVIDQNEKLIGYIKEKGLLDESGNFK